jgi:hypothetical protein
MRFILPQPIYTTVILVLSSHPFEEVSHPKALFRHVQSVSYTTSASFSENIFVRTLKLSFILKVETCNAPTTIRVLTCDEFSGTKLLFANTRKGTYRLKKMAWYINILMNEMILSLAQMALIIGGLKLTLTSIWCRGQECWGYTSSSQYVSMMRCLVD